MPLQLEALPALHGDALLLHYGTEAQPLLIIVDGGPSTVYYDALKPRLEEIKASRSPNAPLPVRLIMVSHIDADHITGILDLASELEDTAGERYVAVTELWHNAFTGLLGDEADAFLKAAAGAAKISATDSTVPDDVRQEHPSAAMIASVGQGKKLRTLAENKFGWRLNAGRPLLIADGSKKDTIDVGGNVTITLLGPTAERLTALREEWRKKTKEPDAGKGASIVAYLDRSAPNLASIVALVSDGTKKILLTGDARGDYILKGTAAAKLVQNGKVVVDVLKVPHHGSIRDLDKDFFQTITAKHYVISANGKYQNPDIESLQLLIDARGDDDYKIHLTYPVEEFGSGYDRDALQKLVDESKGRIIPRDPNAKSVIV